MKKTLLCTLVALAGASFNISAKSTTCYVTNTTTDIFLVGVKTSYWLNAVPDEPMQFIPIRPNQTTIFIFKGGCIGTDSVKAMKIDESTATMLDGVRAQVKADPISAATNPDIISKMKPIAQQLESTPLLVYWTSAGSPDKNSPINNPDPNNPEIIGGALCVDSYDIEIDSHFIYSWKTQWTISSAPSTEALAAL